MSYKTELHCHTNYSGCSNVSPADMVEKYVAAGYSTVVITNHFNQSHLNRDGDFDALVRGTFNAINEARAAADGRLNIIAGMELTLHCMPNDFLLYGVTEEFVRSMGEELFDICPWHFKDRFKESDIIVIQAHPFRFNQNTVNPEHVHGIEVFNGHTGQYSHNSFTEQWVDYMRKQGRIGDGFILTSGTDHHDDTHYPTGGIETEHEIKTSGELLSVLRSGEYKLITSPLGKVEG